MKVNRPLIVTLAILVLASVLVLGCGLTTAVYNNHKYGYSVEAPKNWSIGEGDTESDTVCYGIVNGGLTFNRIVSVHVTAMSRSQELHNVVMDEVDNQAVVMWLVDYCELKVTKLSENHYQLEGRQLEYYVIQWFRTDFVLHNGLLYEVTRTSADSPGDSRNRKNLSKVHVYIDGYGEVR